VRVLTIDHAHSYTHQGTRTIDIDPALIRGIRAVRLHPDATHTHAVEIILAPHGYSETLALPIPWADWEIIMGFCLLRKQDEEADPTATAPGT